MLKWLICLNAVWRKTILVWKNDKIIRTHIFLGVSATGLVLKHELGRVSGHDGDGGGGVEYRRSVSEVPWFWWQIWSLAQQLTISPFLKMKVSPSIIVVQFAQPRLSISQKHNHFIFFHSNLDEISTFCQNWVWVSFGNFLTGPLWQLSPSTCCRSFSP